MTLLARLAALLLMGASVSAHATERTDMNAQYDQPATYSETAPLQYPDFTLRFLGKSEGGTLPNGMPMGAQYRFEASLPDGQKSAVTWSSGTGEIAPRPFIINGQKFTLERSISTTGERLAENQLIIRKSTH